MEEGRHQRAGIELELGQRQGDVHRVLEVRLTGAAHLAVVGLHGELVSFLDRLHLLRREVLTGPVEQLLDSRRHGNSLAKV